MVLQKQNVRAAGAQLKYTKLVFVANCTSIQNRNLPRVSTSFVYGLGITVPGIWGLNFQNSVFLCFRSFQPAAGEKFQYFEPQK